jgi:hypothetical protein
VEPNELRGTVSHVPERVRLSGRYAQAVFGSQRQSFSRRVSVDGGGDVAVHSHVANILAKLEVSSRLRALVFAVRHGIATIE